MHIIYANDILQTLRVSARFTYRQVCRCIRYVGRLYSSSELPIVNIYIYIYKYLCIRYTCINIGTHILFRFLYRSTYMQVHPNLPTITQLRSHQCIYVSVIHYCANLNHYYSNDEEIILLLSTVISSVGTPFIYCVFLKPKL